MNALAVGLDLSLTSTGLAFIDTDLAVRLDRITSKAPDTPRGARSGKKLPPTLAQRHDRLSSLAQRIVERALAYGHPKLVVVEAPSYGSKTGAQHDRSGLWWLVVSALHASWVPTAEITPSQRMKYATGKGQAQKDVVMLAVANRYRDLVEVTGNDEADALVLAAMSARHLGHPIEASLPQTHLAAMSAVTWPAETTEQVPAW